MAAFIQPPFWASSYGRRTRAPHAISVLVTPALPIVATPGAGNVFTTATPHHYLTGDQVRINDIVGGTPPLAGLLFAVNVTSPTVFTVPTAVSVAGTGGTATREIPIEPLTLTEGKLRAAVDWVAGDPRDALMTAFITAARSKVEQDTGLALLSQTRDVYVDAIPGPVFNLPALSKPLQAVISVSSIDTAGAVHVLDASNYVVDYASARLGLSTAGIWPTDLRPFQPYVIRIVSGWPSVASLKAEAPLLMHAVGLLTAHYATLGRDLASSDPTSAVPQGYEDAISSYVPVVVA